MNRRFFIHYILSCITFVLLLKLIRFGNVNANTPEIVNHNRKFITPTITNLHDNARPAKFPATNNLRRKTGSPFLAKGEFLSLEGYVTDIVDVPVENAIVQIWQTNHFGYYNYLVDHDDLIRYDEDFLSCGTYRTNNFGYYHFITIMPGCYGGRAPHIHFSIKHDNFKSVETEMFFPNHVRNKNDAKYIKLSAMERDLLTCGLRPINEKNHSDGKVALFNIKLDGMHPYKRY